jgi:peptide chain release factor 1
MNSIFDKLDSVLGRYEEIEQTMARPEVASDFLKIQALAMERASLEGLVEIGHKYSALVPKQKSLKEMTEDGSDPELVSLAKEELESVNQDLDKLAQALRFALLPQDANDRRDVIVEIRSGAGGREASLFATDLYRMYIRYAQGRNWKVDVMDSNPSESGGFNKMVFEIQGRGAFSRLKYERGVHRVQRVPETEAQGRIHTSTATVAVLPEADEIEANVNAEDLRIDTFHAGGHGGQNVNKVATAIRIVHQPSGLVVVCQDERSQHKNKQKAMAILTARLYAAEQDRQAALVTQNRRAQVGSAERSEKIRTYNYPQDRITDHRVSTTFHGMQRTMDGDLDEIIDALVVWEQTQLLEEVLT